MVRLGQRLYDERKRKGLSLEEVAAGIKIRSEFLMAIEKGDYASLPSPTYAQGFVSNYATYLGFPKRETLALFRREFDEQKAFKVLPKGFSSKEAYHKKPLQFRRTTMAIIAIFICLFLYLVFQYRSVFLSPTLTVSDPKPGSNVKQDVFVDGHTDADAVVSVNGEIVSVDSAGAFKKHLSLLPGKSDIQIIAKNRYGKFSTIDRIVNVSP